jgi:hypothetical protein
MFEKLNCLLKGHDWSDWTYHKENDCEQIQSCKRCGTIREETRHEHQFTSWDYIEDGNCVQTSKCNRCKSEQQRTQHNYPEKKECGTKIKCKRCGNTELVEHFFRLDHLTDKNFNVNIGEFDIPTVGVIYKCKNCGATENRVMPKSLAMQIFTD